MDTQPTATNYTDGSKATHEEQDEDQKWDWYVGGMIIHDSKIHLVTVHQAFLVLDTPAWAAAHATAHAEASKTATTDEARSLNERVARGLRRWLEGDANYLEDGFPLWALVPAIAFRARIGVLEVNEANFDQYMARLMARTIPARRDVPPAFVLLADTERPCIWATGDASYMVDFASPGVVTESVSQDQLWYNFQQFVRAYEMASPNLGGADQDLSGMGPAVKSSTPVQGKPLVNGQSHIEGENHAMAALYDAWGMHREVKTDDLSAHDLLFSIMSGTSRRPGDAAKSAARRHSANWAAGNNKGNKQNG